MVGLALRTGASVTCAVRTGAKVAAWLGMANANIANAVNPL